MDLGLTGTDAGSGVGRGVAEALGREGARVAVVARARETVEGAVERVRAAGAQALGFTADMSARPEVDRVVARAWGAPHIAISGSQALPASVDLAEAAYDLLAEWLRAQVLGAAYLAHAVLHGIKELRWGRIIVMRRQLPRAGQRHAALSKGIARAGVAELVRGLFEEYKGCGITTNALTFGRVSEVEEQAEVLNCLGSFAPLGSRVFQRSWTANRCGRGGAGQARRNWFDCSLVVYDQPETVCRGAVVGLGFEPDLK